MNAGLPPQIAVVWGGEGLSFDIKCLDDAAHRAWTGVSNRRILENFRQVRAAFPGVEVVVRTPVIPGFNDTAIALDAIAAFVTEAGGAAACERLPYHRLGEPKYARLGKTYPMDIIEPAGA